MIAQLPITDLVQCLFCEFWQHMLGSGKFRNIIVTEWLPFWRNISRIANPVSSVCLQSHQLTVCGINWNDL